MAGVALLAPAEWGPVDLACYSRNHRGHRDDECYLARHAQALRVEAFSGGCRTETAMFFGDGEHRGAGIERRLRVADWRQEARLEAAYAREQPPVHGTAGAYRTCRDADGRRCPACRAYQAGRVAANRADRPAARIVGGPRAGAQLPCARQRCIAQNSAGCARWRRGRAR